MKDIQELRSMSIEDLQEELMTLRQEQFNLRMKKASGALEKPHFIKIVRRSIARVKTIMTEKAGNSHVQ